MDLNPVPVLPRHARKKGKSTDKWKKNIAQLARYSPKDLPGPISCMHHSKKLQCSTLKMHDLFTFHRAFYKSRKKKDQVALILKCCTPMMIKRRRPNRGQRKPRDFSIRYTIYAGKKLIPVCQKTFLQCLNIKKYRVQHVMKQFFETGEAPREKRGGDHKKHLFAAKLRAIHEFITSLTCSEPHYCRGSTQARQYLPSELNVNKLHKLYITCDVVKQNPNLVVKKSYFRLIFNTCYNLGFGTPRTDMCSKCIQLTEQLKTEENPERKNDLMMQKRIHVLRSKAFFHMLKEKKQGMKTFSFDCQKNLPLPKVPDQLCYYSRQLYLYNFTICEGTSKDQLSPENVHSYLWTENEYKKGSNEIASAVYDTLNKADFRDITCVRLVADGCGGQNKNCTMLGMCSKWLLDHPTVKTVELVFPVPGHSFMPPDRVFGNIEKDIRKKEVIVDPKEYVEIIKTHSTVVNLSDCVVSNWYEAVTAVLKSTSALHFKISLCKRFLIKRSKKEGNVLIRGEVYYKSDLGASKSVCKANKKTSMINPATIPVGNAAVKALKLRDVYNLLTKHYGPQWRNLPALQYYKEIIPDKTNDVPDANAIQDNANVRPDENPPVDDDIFFCEIQEDSSELRV